MEQWELYWKDYYEILQLSRHADTEIINAAYKKLAQRYHPDSSKNPNTTFKMKEINEAYSILSNVDRRREYDNAFVQHYFPNQAHFNQTNPTNNKSKENDDLGKVLYHVTKHKQVYERGLKYNNVSVKWDKIKAIFINCQKINGDVIPRPNPLQFNVLDYTNHTINFKLYSSVSTNNDIVDEFFTIYDYIVSKVFRRQMNELNAVIKSGESYSFMEFTIDLSGIHNSMLFDENTMIKSQSILSAGVNTEYLAVYCLDKNRQMICQNIGILNEIANLHLAIEFINDIGLKNINKSHSKR